MYGKSTLGKGLGYGVNITIKKYLSSIVAISFTGGGNKSTCRKPEKYYIHLDQYRLSVKLLNASEWVSVVQRQLSNCSAISWREQVNFKWDDFRPLGWIGFFFVVLAHWNNSFLYVYDAEENKKQHIWHFIFMFGVKSLDFLQNDKQNMLKLIINLIDNIKSVTSPIQHEQ